MRARLSPGMRLAWAIFLKGFAGGLAIGLWAQIAFWHFSAERFAFTVLIAVGGGIASVLSYRREHG